MAASIAVARSKSVSGGPPRCPGSAGASTSSWRSSAGRTRSHVRGESMNPCRQTITASGRRRPTPVNGTRMHLGPAVGELVQPLRHRAAGLEVAPHEHGRPGAGDRRAERAEVARLLHELPRARIEVGAARLVDAVAEPARDQVEVPAGQAEHEQRGVGDVEHGVRDRDPRRQRVARLRRAHGLAGDDQQALQPGRRLEALGVSVRAQHEAAEQRRRDVVRVALQPRGLGQHVRAEFEDRVGRHEPGDDRRGARAEPAGERDVAA